MDVPDDPTLKASPRLPPEERLRIEKDIALSRRLRELTGVDPEDESPDGRHQDATYPLFT